MDTNQIPAFIPHITFAERIAFGKSLREKCPRTSHARWQPPHNRPDPVDLVLESDKGRIPGLVPLRHGRMVQSPFTFYRGAAFNMASDLSLTPSNGTYVQCCGDAHLSNFGGFATPERKIIFSINDLDESLPAPWEWDVKRLSASFVVACRNNGISESAANDVVMSCVQSYRERMARFSEMKILELWYHKLDGEMLVGKISDSEVRKRAGKRMDKERKSRTLEDVFPKLTEDSTYGGKVIKDQPPTIYHWEGHQPGEIDPFVKKAFAGYRESLSPSNRWLLDRYELKDIAIKVVGVGSVGTACWVLLLTAGDRDPLFLQAKEARPSVLAAFAGKSTYDNHGQRIVNGYRLMQPSSDILLGWTQGDLQGSHYYFRQLRDMKVKVLVETFGKAEMTQYAKWCGHALALSHARSGDSAVLSAYMGKSETFDKAITGFSFAYADQNEKDHAALKRAIATGKVQAAYDVKD
jgi:uncharacterized protein (DUF2252 family)